LPRIAHVISTTTGIGGAERVVGALLRGGEARGWQQRTLNPFALDPDRAALRALCPPGTYAGRACHSLAGLPRLRGWLRSELDEFRPHIVHAHLFHAEVAVASLRRPFGARLVLSHHHADHFLHAGLRFRAAIDRTAGRRFDRVVAVSRSTESFLTHDYGYAVDAVACISNGWDATPRGGDGLRDDHLSPDAPTVVCVANFRPQKGHDVLLAAFARVVRRVPAAKLVLVGDGDLRVQIERDVRARGIEGSVDLIGETHDVWPWLERAHVFALASHYEPLGIAILEAMAAGLPVVATAVGGIPELVQPNTTGLLVPNGDVDALADGLLTLLLRAELRDRMGKAGRAAAQLRTVDQMVGQYFQLYDRLMADRGYPA